MPHFRHGRRAVAIDNKIWVFGGLHKETEASNEWLQHIQVYEPANGYLGPLPNAVPWLFYTTQAVLHDGEVYLFSRLVWENGDWAPCRMCISSREHGMLARG